jgi:ribonuclease P protein component
MLQRSQRLSVEQFNVVMAKGKISQSPFFSIRFMKCKGPTKISAVAGQKIFKKAVERTTLRRKIYEVVRNMYPLLVPESHIAVFAKQSLDSLDHQTMAEELKKAFVKAGLIR